MQNIAGTTLRKFYCVSEMWVCYNNGTNLLVHDGPSAPKHIHDVAKKKDLSQLQLKKFCYKTEKDSRAAVAFSSFCLKRKQYKTEVAES